MAIDSRPAVQLRARAELAAGELGAAESLGQILVDADAHDVQGLTLLAEIAAARGQPTRAADWLRRSLAVDPYDPEARALVARLQPPGVLGD
jgi:predicted Zn-dependent protease